MIMKSAINVEWRCVTPPNDEGLMGIAFDGEDKVYRFMIPVEDARHVAGAIMDCIDINKPFKPTNSEREARLREVFERQNQRILTSLQKSQESSSGLSYSAWRVRLVSAHENLGYYFSKTSKGIVALVRVRWLLNRLRRY